MEQIYPKAKGKNSLQVSAFQKIAAKKARPDTPGAPLVPKFTQRA